MIEIHLGFMVAIFLLWAGGKMGKIPYQYYVDEKEYHRILLVLLLGNLLGMVMTLQNNQGRYLQEGAYIQRPAVGEGSDTKEFLVKAGSEELSLMLDIPQQEGQEEEETKEEKISPEESLREAIVEAAILLNEEKQEADKYYLPSQVQGKKLQWAYPVDHSGVVLLGLTVVAGILLLIAKERNREAKRIHRKEQMIRDYPNLVTKLCLLVQAGMTVRRAFGKTALDYRKNHPPKEEPQYAYEEMLVTYYEMESGVMEAQAYDNFGRRCEHAQYRTLATLLSQNLKKGNHGLLEILERESVTAFEDRKRQAKMQGEAAATKLLFPMVLMLLVVLVILMVPACMSFYG